MGPITEPHCSRRSGYLLHHQHLFQVAQARAAILNWELGPGSGMEKAAQITLGQSQECLPAAKKHPCSSYYKLPSSKVGRLTPWALLYQLMELALPAASGQLRWFRKQSLQMPGLFWKDLLRKTREPEHPLFRKPQKCMGR